MDPAIRNVSIWRTVCAWTIGVFLTVLVSVFGVIVGLLHAKGDYVHRGSLIWSKLMLWVCGVKVVVRGEEFLPENTDHVVIVANHQSMFDICAFSGYFPIRFAWIAKKELFRIPLFGGAMRAAGYIAIDRVQKQEAVSALDQAAHQLQNFTIAIFPEGTRTSDGKIARFKAGAVFLAEATKAPFLPVTIMGSYQCMPKGKWSVSPGTITLQIEPPVPTAGKSRREIYRDLKSIRNNMIENLAKSQGIAS